MKTLRKIASVILFTVFASIVLSSCGGLESKLVGSWGPDGGNRIYFTLYDDGMCKIENEYGTGKWNVVDGNKLKLTNFYGESETIEISEADGNTIEFTNGNKFVKKDAE